MASTPEAEKDNWWRFGDPSSENSEDEIVFDPDVDDVEFDSFEDDD